MNPFKSSKNMDSFARTLFVNPKPTKDDIPNINFFSRNKVIRRRFYDNSNFNDVPITVRKRDWKLYNLPIFKNPN